jgi:5-methylcytosine-specific restriction endonuclease McrA
MPSTNDVRSHTTGYTEELDEQRKSARWQRVRDIIIKRDPFCKRCVVARSEIVDHIVPADVAIMQAQQSGRYPYDKYAGYYLKTNLQGLCRSCHWTKTNEDKAHVGPWPSVMESEDKVPKKVWSF